jgi:hypothetical protein
MATRKVSPARATRAPGAHIVFAQYEHGPIVVAITSDPSNWRDEEVRLKSNAFGRFEVRSAPDPASAQASIDAICGQVRQSLGDDHVLADQRLAKMFHAEWPMVLNAANQAGVPAMREAA